MRLHMRCLLGLLVAASSGAVSVDAQSFVSVGESEATLELLPIPPAPENQLGIEMLAPPRVPELDNQSPVDVDVRALGRALDVAALGARNLRLFRGYAWLAAAGLTLGAGVLMAVHITPAPLSPFFLSAGILTWAADAFVAKSAVEDLRERWRALSVSERRVAYPRFVRQFRSVAQRERRDRELRMGVGLTLLVVGVVLAGVMVAIDGPIGIAVFSASAGLLGGVVGMAALEEDETSRVERAFSEGRYRDPRFELPELDPGW